MARAAENARSAAAEAEAANGKGGYGTASSSPK